ncbi:MAG: hypothetical protein ACI9GH_000036 [Candidatus Paceibacteria bacterium]|jgi:uncharacterized protein (DUF885 family)
MKKFQKIICDLLIERTEIVLGERLSVSPKAIKDWANGKSLPQSAEFYGILLRLSTISTISKETLKEIYNEEVDEKLKIDKENDSKVLEEKITTGDLYDIHRMLEGAEMQSITIKNLLSLRDVVSKS